MQHVAIGRLGEFLSPEIAEALRQTSVACSENENEESGFVDFFCGRYLQFRD
jgi:hypothetical protein